jgi:hypothetical protein
LECGSSSYRLGVSAQHDRGMKRSRKAVAAATALQGAAHIFVVGGAPKAHGRLCGSGSALPRLCEAEGFFHNHSCSASKPPIIDAREFVTPGDVPRASCPCGVRPTSPYRRQALACRCDPHSMANKRIFAGETVDPQGGALGHVDAERSRVTPTLIPGIETTDNRSGGVCHAGESPRPGGLASSRAIFTCSPYASLAFQSKFHHAALQTLRRAACRLSH